MKNNVLKITIILGVLLIFFSSLNVMAVENLKEDILKNQNELKNIIKTSNGIEISSNEYLISEIYSYIGRILPRTTVEQFKSTFNIEKDQIHIYKDADLKEEIDDGYIATNMTVIFDKIDKPYLTSVVGDFNEDGISNQIEIQQLIRHILSFSDAELTGIKLLCADINKDGIVNQIDLTALINYVVFGRLNIGEVMRPENPTIEIIGGEQLSTGWYITYPTLKIIEKETEDIEKTTYKISGVIEEPETEIPDDGIIKLTKDGIYDIVAYSYSKDGAKSEPAKIQIKVCTQEIDDEDIQLEMRVNNKNGEIYEQDIWTNQNVYINLIQMNEESSEIPVNLNLTYKVVGSTTVSEETTSEMIIENEGVSTVIVTATDEIGRKRTKEFIVKIDKTSPENSTMEIIGNKLDSEYYNEDVEITVFHGVDVLSGINKVTYELQGDQIKEETQIDNEENFIITEDGITKIIVRTYDNAGNMKVQEETIRKDVQGPKDITVVASEITGTGFKLTAKAKDEGSGILRYEFFIDGNKYGVVETEEEMAEYFVTEQTSGVHEVEVLVVDNAENVSNLSKIEVETEKLQNSEISHIEFSVENFNVQNDIDKLDKEQVEGIVSDTSLTSESKYIQVTLGQNGTMATVEGKIKIVRKDGIVVEDINYFPEDLIIEVSHFADGSGSSVRHQTMSELLGVKIYEGEITQILPAKNMSIIVKGVIGNENKFKISEKKLLGVNTYTRFTIENIMIGSELIPFKISM